MDAGNQQGQGFSNTGNRPQTQAYRQFEQEKKPQPMAQPQGAAAPQPNAQPQTFATLQRQGFARPNPPQPQKGIQMQGAPQGGGIEPRAGGGQGGWGRNLPPDAQNAYAGQQDYTNSTDPDRQLNNFAFSGGAQGNYQSTGIDARPGGGQNGGQMTNGQGLQMQGAPNGGGLTGTAMPQQFDGFNGAAPNFNPLDYMVGQMMQPGQGTDFGGMAGQTQFQGYTPAQLAQFQGALTNYSGAGGDISVQGGGGGVAANYQGNDLNPYGKSTFTNQGGPVADATQQKMLDLLAKPSGWDSELVQNMYGKMGGQIDDQFAQQDTAINEEMAKRGLYDSSIAAGRLKDSNIGRRDAKTNLADSLLQQMGMNYGNDQARAAGLGAGYQGQQFGEQSTAFGLNQGAEQQAFGQQLGAEQARQGAFGLNQQGQMANSQAGIAAMNANLQAQQANQANRFQYAGLNSQNALANNSQLLDRARFQSGENQFGTNVANQNAQQRFQNALTGGQQDFNNRVTNTGLQRDMLGNIVNYGQQQFNNDMTQQNFNRQLGNDQFEQLLATLGLR